MPEWVAVAKEAELQEGAMKGVAAKGIEMLVVRLGGKVYAMESECTHQGGPLAEGELNDSVVTCPWHQAQFDVKTGKVMRGPAQLPQKVHKVKIEDGKVMVEV